MKKSPLATLLSPMLLLIAPIFGEIGPSSVVALAAAAFVEAAPGVAAAADANATRVTSSFEIKHTPAVLKKVEKLFSAGFTHKEATQLAHEIDHMKSDLPMSWTYNVTYQGEPRTLEVHALLDGLGMLDLDFVSAPDTTLAIRKAVDAYLNAH